MVYIVREVREKELFYAGIKLITYVIEDVIFHVVRDDGRLWWSAYFLGLKKSELVLKRRRNMDLHMSWIK